MLSLHVGMFAECVWGSAPPSHSHMGWSSRTLCFGGCKTPAHVQRSQSGLTEPLFRCSVGTYLEMSSHTTCQETFGQVVSAC